MKYLDKPLSQFIRLSYKDKVDKTETPLMQTSGSLFANDLMSTDLIVERFMNNPYEKKPDGSINMNLQSFLVDTHSFYLFAHKLLVSALLIMRIYLPNEYVKKVNFPVGKFGKFYNYVYSKENDLTRRIKDKMEPELKWAMTKIVDKRDKMVQHWSTNIQNQLMTTVQVFDLPMITYQHPVNFESSVDKQKLSYWTEKIAKKYKTLYTSNSMAGYNLAFLEAWYPKLSEDEKKVVDGFLNPDTFIALPVSPIIIGMLSSYLEKVFEITEEVNKESLDTQV